MEYLNGVLAATVIGLYVLGVIIKDTPKVPSWTIPYVLLIVSIIISPLILGGYTAEHIVQAIIAAGLAVYGNQLLKQGAGALKEFGKEEDEE